ncbi:MAG: hypothetical protein ABIS01_16795 [Ferruginibacter sp.]
MLLKKGRSFRKLPLQFFSNKFPQKLQNINITAFKLITGDKSLQTGQFRMMKYYIFSSVKSFMAIMNGGKLVNIFFMSRAEVFNLACLNASIRQASLANMILLFFLFGKKGK